MAIRPVLSRFEVGAVRSAWTLLSLASLVSGCGRSAEPFTQPAAESPAPSSVEKEASATETLEQAEAELERARLALAELGPPPGSPPATVAAAPAEPSQAPQKESTEKKRRAAAADEASPSAGSAPAAPKRAAPMNQAEARDSEAKSEEDPCLTTCKAFASLVRAKDAVCRLDVPNGARCARAEGIVKDTAPRVQSCQCAR